MLSEQDVRDLMRNCEREKTTVNSRTKTNFLQGKIDALSDILENDIDRDECLRVIHKAEKKCEVFENMAETPFSALPGLSEFIGSKISYYDGMTMVALTVLESEISYDVDEDEKGIADITIDSQTIRVGTNGFNQNTAKSSRATLSGRF